MDISLRPRLLMADAQGNIYDHPDLLMLCRRGNDWALPRPDDLMPLPDESELFLLPGRHAVGLSPESGETVVLEDLAVAAFAAPAHTLTAHPVYDTDENAPTLPLFAYGAVGLVNDRFYICARKVDNDTRQVFADIPFTKIAKNARSLISRFPQNRLMQHLMSNCVLRYSCPAARNLCIGRAEAPLPVSRVCNARCIGCISQQEQSSQICASPQNRMAFTPTVSELVEVMHYHARNESQNPVFSFGQGCEGEPLTEAPLLIETVSRFRREQGRGTINLNTNASRPDAVIGLAEAGLSSMRVSMNSAREEAYTRYYRPISYTFDDVRRSMCEARSRGVFVSINLLFFPGITDTEEEFDALIHLITECGVSFIQLRNLNIDPEMYLELMQGIHFGPSLGLQNFRKRLRRACPWLEFGYFNPYLGDKAEISAPMPGERTVTSFEDVLEELEEAQEE